MTPTDNYNNPNFNNKVLFIGNGINNLNNKESWENLVQKLRRRVGKEVESDDLKTIFPLAFETLLNYGIKNGSITNEDELKSIVAKNVDSIIPNRIHERIESRLNSTSLSSYTKAQAGYNL